MVTNVIVHEGSVERAFKESLKIYEQVLNQSRLSDNTRSVYIQSLNNLSEWLNERPLTPTNVQEWLNELSKLYATNTLNVRRAAVVFIAKHVERLARETFAHNQEQLHLRTEIVNRATLIQQIPAYVNKGVKLGEWLMESEVRQLLGEMPDKYKLLTRLIVGTGLRISEALDLKPKDILIRDGRQVVNVFGKGDKYRIVPIPSWVGLDEHFKGFEFTRGSYYYALTGASERLFDKKITPHDLRRTAARLWYLADPTAIYEISQILGHASIEQTLEYIGATVDLANSVNDLVSF